MKAVLITKDNDTYEAKLSEVDEAQLPEGNVTVKVDYSTLNYKDGLAITGASPVVRQFPMVPGVDLAGTVEDSSHPDYKAGDAVVLNGWGVGEVHWGGLAQKARLNGDWLVPLPDRFSARDAMAIGTAGYTAMLCVIALEKAGISPSSGPVVVTGANGGVGSVAIAILSKLGYHVIASTGRPNEADFLKDLGASEIIDRAELSEPGRPMGKERWVGGVDAVGSHTLANVIAQTSYGGAVAACGLAQGFDLPMTVMPFILRGVSLLGIDSVMQPKDVRIEAWNRIAQDLDLAKLEAITTVIGFDQIIETATDIVDGKVRGRVAIDMKA